MLELMYASGLRVSELVTLKRGGIDLRQGVVQIVGKGGKERLVPIGEEAMHWVERYVREVRGDYAGAGADSLFLTTRGEAMTRQNFWMRSEEHTSELQSLMSN